MEHTDNSQTTKDKEQDESKVSTESKGRRGKCAAADLRWQRLSQLELRSDGTQHGWDTVLLC